ncbi:MAG TPA: SRPBCC family protein [Candidatus Limnocylindrales bacterium]|jgi:hypothetical protein
MAIAVELETPIARNCDDVFARLVELAAYPEWLVASGIVRAEALGAGPLAPGTPIRVEQRIAGRATVLEGAVTAFEPGRRFGFKAKDPEGISIDVDGRLDADGATCRLVWAVKLGLPLKYRLFESMVAPEVRRAAATDLEAFRRRLQSVAGEGRG